METLTAARYSTRDLVILYFAVLGLFGYIFFEAWVCEDAYITFRVIDNFMNGYGLRWNVYERVQAYTHPLWMLLNLAIYAVWGNIFLSNIALSIACTTGAIVLSLATVRKSLPVTLCCFLLPLALSKSFMDYSTSGLENPLGYLLYALFGYVVVRQSQHRHFWFYLSLTVALSLFNRLDTIILFLPALMWLALTRLQEKDWPQIILGALPLIYWFGFSFFYYGFLFPNTKYAKLNTGLDLFLYLRQGLRYAKYLLQADMLGAVTLLGLPLILAHQPRRRSSLDNRMPWFAPCMAAGIIAYGFYIIYIGGDYMMGRFWALPVFAALWLWHVWLPERLRADVIFLLLCMQATLYLIPPILKDIHKSCRSCMQIEGRVMDAHSTFSPNRLIAGRKFPLRIRTEGQYVFAENGRKMAAEDPPPVRQMYYIGMSAYYAGPQAKLIDELALADPLLARLPANGKENFYIGHFRRNVPTGYLNAIKTGSLDKMDPALAMYYNKLRLITSGNLSDPHRLMVILKFNLGMYDHWKEDYISRNP